MRSRSSRPPARSTSTMLAMPPCPPTPLPPSARVGTPVSCRRPVRRMWRNHIHGVNHLVKVQYLQSYMASRRILRTIHSASLMNSNLPLAPRNGLPVPPRLARPVRGCRGRRPARPAHTSRTRGRRSRALMAAPTPGARVRTSSSRRASGIRHNGGRPPRASGDGADRRKGPRAAPPAARPGLRSSRRTTRQWRTECACASYRWMGL